MALTGSIGPEVARTSAAASRRRLAPCDTLVRHGMGSSNGLRWGAGGRVAVALYDALPARTARVERKDDHRAELYAEWLNGMNRLVYSKLDKPIDIIRVKLLLIEPDAKLRDLIAKVQASVPDPQTEAGDHFYYMVAQDPDPSWPPFDTAIKELTDAVRDSLKR